MARRGFGGMTALRAALGAVTGITEGLQQRDLLAAQKKREEEANALARFNALRAAGFGFSPVRTATDPAAREAFALETPDLPAPTMRPSAMGTALAKTTQEGLGVSSRPTGMLDTPISLALDTSRTRQLERGAGMQPASPAERLKIGGVELGIRSPEEMATAKKGEDDAQFEAAIANLSPEAQRLARMSRVLPSNVVQAIATPRQEGMTEYQQRTLALRERELGMRQERTREEKSPKEEKPRFGEVSSLRKEFNTESRPYKTINDALKNIEALGTKPNPTPQDLQALVYQFVKVQDPTSVVRESEYANAANAAALTDKMSNYANRVLNGQTLSPKQRADMVQTARALRVEAMSQYSQLANSYEELAGSFGMDPKTIVPNRLDRGAQKQEKPSGDSAYDAAKQAIAQGANPAAVRQRYEQATGKKWPGA